MNLTLVPSPGELLSANTPPISSSRFLMLVNPLPVGLHDVFNWFVLEEGQGLWVGTWDSGPYALRVRMVHVPDAWSFSLVQGVAGVTAR
jgi:hypothetical protein